MSPGIARIFPWGVALLGALYLIVAALPEPRAEGEMRLEEFGRLVVVHQGRQKPFDTFARNSLVKISGRQDFVDETGRTQPAIRWLLDVMASELQERPVAEHHRVFRIDNDQVLNFLGLQARPGFRYAVAELRQRWSGIEREARRASSLERGRRDLFDEKILELASQLQWYLGIARMEIPHAVPPAGPNEEWKPLAAAFQEEQQTGRVNTAARSIGSILVAYAEGATGRFNEEVLRYRASQESQFPGVVRSAEFEALFNRMEPFYRCSVLYLAVFLLAGLSWLGWALPLRKSAFLLGVVALVLHTAALIARIILSGRPPVTNLYSSAIFVGWACVGLAMVLERLYRNGICTMAASVTGFVTLLIAHFLARKGDTLEMLQAVLDTNFWLATHVTCITIGYSAGFLAGFLGIVYILRGVFTRSLDPEAARTLGRMIYGVVCFATLFSFVGTVLGGLWADQSWGRFWGWDPKENGALLIVLSNAMILHARWGGMIQHRGVAVLSVFGNIVTAWSWFGVNMLGVGLHSYGFMGSAAFWLVAFVASQLAVIGIGLLPRSCWRSLKAEAGERQVAPPAATVA